MSRMWRFFLPGYVLLLPNVLVALVYALCIGAHSWKWREGTLTFVSSRMLGSPGGQGWSWVIGYASEEHREVANLRVHELTHLVQEMAACLLALAAGSIVALGGFWQWGIVVGCSGGLLFAVAYGLGFLIPWLLSGGGPWRDAYHANWFERHAYAVQDRYLAMRPSEQVDVWGHR